MWTYITLWQHLSAVLLAVLLVAALAPPEFALAQEPGPHCPFIPNTTGGVTQANASGQDLTATLEWETATKLPETAVVEVRDLHGHLLASQVIQPRSGQQSQVTFAGVLSDFEAHGLVYRIEVSDDLADPYEVRVALDCPPNQECRYQLTENMSSEALVVDKALEAALENTSPESLDILGDILKEAPDMAGQVATLAYQLKSIDKRFGIPNKDCVCFWRTREIGPSITQVLTEPSSYQGLYQVDSPTSVRARSEQNGAFNLLTSGQVNLSVAMVCGRLKSWSKSMTVPLPGSVSTLVPMPVIEGCANDSCSATVNYNLNYDGRLEIQTVVPDGTPSEFTPMAFVSETFNYQVDGKTVLTQGDSLVAPTPTNVLDGQCYSSIEEGTVPSEAILNVISEIEVISPEEPEYCTLAEGQFTAVYTMSASVEATCSVPAVAGVRVPRNQQNRRAIGAESAGIFREPYCQ